MRISHLFDGGSGIHRLSRDDPRLGQPPRNRHVKPAQPLHATHLVHRIRGLMVSSTLPVVILE